ncbi:unnamed protein product, partial [Symbiodinium necroappetens]
VTLIDLGIYGTGDVKVHLEVIYEELVFYCSKGKIPLHMMGLTRTLVGYGSSADYPTGNWFKGADTVSLCKFLQHKFASVLVACAPDERPYVRNILAMLRACNTFMSTMYHGDVFLTDDERRILIRNGHVVTTKFAACASHAYHTLNIPRYKYQPKYHFFAEVVYKLESDQR